MMEVSKVLLYCTKAKPFMAIDEDGYHLVEHPTGDLKDYAGKVINGLIGFECDCKEAFVCYPMANKGNKYPSIEPKSSSMDFRDFYKRTCLCPKEVDQYANLKRINLYAYHFENVKPIDPMPITQLYRDGTMVYPLTRAPQSYCFAYRKVETTKEDYLANVGKDESRYYLQENGKFFYSEKFLVFSIRSPWVCKIANGNKDLEVRKTRIANARIEYK